MKILPFIAAMLMTSNKQQTLFGLLPPPPLNAYTQARTFTVATTSETFTLIVERDTEKIPHLMIQA